MEAEGRRVPPATTRGNGAFTHQCLSPCQRASPQCHYSVTKNRPAVCSCMRRVFVHRRVLACVLNLVKDLVRRSSDSAARGARFIKLNTNVVCSKQTQSDVHGRGCTACPRLFPSQRSFTPEGTSEQEWLSPETMWKAKMFLMHLTFHILRCLLLETSLSEVGNINRWVWRQWYLVGLYCFRNTFRRFGSDSTRMGWNNKNFSNRGYIFCLLFNCPIVYCSTGSYFYSL